MKNNKIPGKGKTMHFSCQNLIKNFWWLIAACLFSPWNVKLKRILTILSAQWNILFPIYHIFFHYFFFFFLSSIFFFFFQKTLKPNFYFRWCQNYPLFPVILTFLFLAPRKRKLIPFALLLTPSITVGRYPGVWGFTPHPKVLRFEYLLLWFGSLLAICINVSSL